MKVMKKAVAMVLAAMLFASFQIAYAGSVEAASELMSGGSFVTVSYTGQVVDSITTNGVKVDAIFRPYTGTNGTDSTYSCAAFVSKYYSKVFGVSVSNLWGPGYTPILSKGTISVTTSPKIGDIVRDNVQAHWAIVKSVNSSGVVTVIQQNAWNTERTKAWVGAKIYSGNSRYTYFRYSGNNADIHTIAYNANGGSGTIASSAITSGSAFTIAKSGFTRSGYTLSGFNVYRKSDKRWYTSGGWATSSEITSGNYTKKLYAPGSSYNFNSSWTNGASAGDTYTFYAVWALNSYTLAYNANGGEGTIASSTIKLGETMNVLDCQFAREGYYFDGYYWCRKSDFGWYVPGKGWFSKNDVKNNGYSMRVYQPGESLVFTTSCTNGASANDTFTFYPVWRPENPTVTFYENFGGVNYMSAGIKSSDEVFAENYYSRDTSVYTVTRDDEIWLNNQPSIKIVAAGVGANNKDFCFNTDTNKGIEVLGCAPDEKQMTLSFWAKGSVDGAKLYWRWGCTTDYYSVTLTQNWKKYTVDVTKNTYDSDGLCFYLDKAGTFYMNNLYLRDGISSEHYAQETGGIVDVVPYEYGLTYEELPELVREGYIFKGWYTAKTGGTEITADTEVLPYNINLYAHWEKEIVDLAIETVYDESGKKYELYQNSVSWEEAKMICEEKGGHLVTINSEEENDLVLSMIEDNVSFTWIGASYDTKTSTWNWVTDETFEYTNWNTGEPSVSDTNDEYYAHMYSIDIGTSETKGKWNDISGSSSLATYYGVPNSMYICEYEPQDVEYEVYTAGDVNQDGTINIFDVFMLARYNAGYIEFTEEQLLIGDTNSDSNINIFDVFMVARYNAGYDVELPVVTIVIN